MYTGEEVAQAVVTTLTKLSLTALGAGIGYGCGIFCAFVDLLLGECKKQKEPNPWLVRVPTIVGAGLGFFAGSTIGPAIFNVGESALDLVLKKS